MNKITPIESVYSSVTGTFTVAGLIKFKEKGLPSERLIIFEVESIDKIPKTWDDMSLQGEVIYTDAKDWRAYLCFTCLEKLATTAWFVTKPKHFLVLGLGIGNLSNHFKEAIDGSRVTAVEINPIVHQLAQKYAALNPQVRVLVQDAFKYIHTTESVYDVVAVDIFSGVGNEDLDKRFENPGMAESLHRIMSNKGIVICNLNEYLEPWHNKIYKRFCSNMMKAGFKHQAILGLDEADIDNPILVCSPNPLNNNARLKRLATHTFPSNINNLYEAAKELSFEMLT